MSNNLKGKYIQFYNILLTIIIIFGCLLRLKGLLLNPSLWHDECALAYNIKFKNFIELLSPLNFEQMAPPLFLILTKIITKIFGFSDFVLRILPFIIGCSSIFVFFILAQNVLKNKISILFALFIFVINSNLINYSFEFKPYGSDVFFTIICLLFFINLDITRVSIKKLFVYGLLLAFTPWLSFTSIFIIFAGILNLFFKNMKQNLYKNITLFFPMIISIGCYLSLYLINNYRYSSGSGLINFWSNYFVNGSFQQFIFLLTNNLRYLFVPSEFILFILILILLGAYGFWKERKTDTCSTFLNISVISFVCLLTASFLHLYPFAERMILFLLPIILLFISKVVDEISFNKKLKSFIITIFCLLIFCPEIAQLSQFAMAKSIDKDEYPREMMQYMVNNIKKDDIIFVNNVSDAEFAYYSSFYNIKNKVLQERNKNSSEDDYISYLYKLPKGKYWFYVPVDYANNPVAPWIEKWASSQIILFHYKNDKNYAHNKSLLMYVLKELN